VKDDLTEGTTGAGIDLATAQLREQLAQVAMSGDYS
jgi:hypothetical protein